MLKSYKKAILIKTKNIAIKIQLEIDASKNMSISVTCRLG